MASGRSRWLPGVTLIAAVVGSAGAPAFAGEPEAVVRVCESGTPPPPRRPPRAARDGSGTDRVICELEEPIIVRPVARGPRHRGPIPYPRPPAEVGYELSWLEWLSKGRVLPGRLTEGPLRGCYRWARWAAPELAGDVTLDVVVDEWGRLAEVTPRAAPTGGDDAAACLAQVLKGMNFGLYTPRRTEQQLTLRLRRSGQALPRERPAHPPATWRSPKRAEPPVCVERPSVLPVDHQTGPPPVVVVDDFSEEQKEAEKLEAFRAAMKAWIASGKRGPKPKRAPNVISCLARSAGKCD